MPGRLVLLFLIIVASATLFISFTPKETVQITIYTDSVLNDVSNHPVGINLNYFMDDGRYPNAPRSTTEALKAMGVKYIRYPGGDKSDFNLFSTYPYEKSAPALARTGKGATDDYANVLKNYKEFKWDVLDFDEFIIMCRKLNAEPVVVVPADGYLKNYPEGCTFTSRDSLLKHAQAWVRYANIKKKYNIKYWMIGNECWNKNNENSNYDIYAKDVLDFAKAMKAVDPTIATIPNGNTVEEFGKVITVAGDYVDYLCLSNYPVWDYRAGYLTYRDTLQNLTGPLNRALIAIEKYATDQQKKKLKLIVSEFGPFDWNNKWPQINDMGHNMLNFEMAGEQLKMPQIEFSCFWNTRWTNNDSIQHEVWDALDNKGGFNANGYGLSIWGNFLGDKMLKTSSTLHIRSFASFSENRKKLFVYLMNKTDHSEDVGLRITTKNIKSVAQAWELIGKNSDDVTPVWRKKKIKNPQNVTLDKMSITVIEYDLK